MPPRKLRNQNGEFLWSSSFTAGQPSTLLGVPVYECQEMPIYGSSLPIIALADFKSAYTIVDRQDMNILRDPYTDKPFVKLYITKRLGGGLTNSDAIKLLKLTENK